METTPELESDSQEQSHIRDHPGAVRRLVTDL
jgi:hypothetical protein